MSARATLAAPLLAVATADHLAACERLLHEAWSDMFGPNRPTGDFADLTHGEEVIVALRSDEVCGFVSLWRPEPFVHLLVVAAAHRGTGVGRALVARAVSELGLPVDLKCGLGNTAAHSFYERLGWRCVQRVTDTDAPHLRYRLDEIPPRDLSRPARCPR